MIYSYALSSEKFAPKSSKVNFNLLCDLDCYSPHACDMINWKYIALWILFIKKQGMKQCTSGFLKVIEEKFLNIFKKRFKLNEFIIIGISFLKHLFCFIRNCFSCYATLQPPFHYINLQRRRVIRVMVRYGSLWVIIVH